MLCWISSAAHCLIAGGAGAPNVAKARKKTVLDSPKHSGRGAINRSRAQVTRRRLSIIDKTSASLSASHSSSNVRLRRLDLPGFDRETTMVRLPRLFSRRAPRGGAARAAPSARRAPHRAASPFRDRASVRSPAHSISPAQALTLYTKDADGSVKAVIAAKAGGLDLTVLPIAQYTGSADASQVRIAAIGSPKPRRGNPETLRTRPRAPFVARNPKRSAPFSRDANASRIKTHPAHLSHHPPS